MSVSVDDMRDKLLTLDDARARLATLEPLNQYKFEVGPDVRFRLMPGWAQNLKVLRGTEPVDAFISIKDREYQLTKDSTLEAFKIINMPATYATKTPARLIEPQLNYWFREGYDGRDYKILENNGLGQVFTSSSMIPYSNLRLLDSIIDGIKDKYGDTEVLVDYKFTNTLRSTYLRLVLPQQRRIMADTGTSNDEWSVGVQLTNSLTSEKKTEVSGYLFRWWCTNGATTVQDQWDRRADRYNSDEDDSWIFDWAKDSTTEILGGVDPALDKIQESAYISLGTDTARALEDIYKQYRVPKDMQTAITDEMVNQSDLTLYSVMQAITRQANDPTRDADEVNNLMRVGADVSEHARERCNSCHRIQF